MSDLSNYRAQVTEYGKRANEAEKAERFDEAYGHYMQALDIFMHLIKCKKKQLLIKILDEKNPQLVKVYREKMG